MTKNKENENVKDPWDINPEEMTKFKNETKMGGSGLICPKRNKSISKPCNVCDTVAVLWKGDEHDKKIAAEKGAKTNYYICAVFPHNKNKAVLVELGKNVGNDLIEGVETKGWTDITNPKAGKGREMILTKSKGDLGFAKYSITPSLKQADWDVPKEVLASLPDITDDIIDTVMNAKEGYIFKVSSLKLGESINLRIVRPSPDKKAINVIFRHFGVTQDEINGKVPMNRTLNTFGKDENKKPEDPAPWEEAKQAEEPKQEKPAEKKIPSCFGRSNFFDENDSSCIECHAFKSCNKEVMKNS